MYNDVDRCAISVCEPPAWGSKQAGRLYAAAKKMGGWLRTVRVYVVSGPNGHVVFRREHQGFQEAS